MKKISTLLAIFLLAITMLTGCNSRDEKSDKTSTDTSQANNLKTFSEVYEADGLEKAIYYLNENFDSFMGDAKKIYMDSLAKQIYDRSVLYIPLTSLEPVEGPAPLIIENVDWLYQGIYNPETNILYKSKLDEAVKIAAQSIEDDDFFVLCKKYYAMDGNIEDMGFDIIVKKEIYDILMDKYADYTDEQNQYFEHVKSYTDYLSTLDTKFESKETYPVVLVKDADMIEMLRNEWKTEVLIPVKIEEKPIETEKPVAQEQEIPKNKVLKNYMGAGVENLSTTSFDAGLDGNTDSVCVFGKIYDVQIGTIRLYTESNFALIKEYDELSNTTIEIKNSASIDEMTNDALCVKFYDKDLNLYTLYFGPESIVRAFEESDEITLKEGSPAKVSFDSGESAIVTDIKGCNDLFSALFLVDNFEEYTTDKSLIKNLYLDADSMWVEYDEIGENTVIPMWVSSNMYNVKVIKSNAGSEESQYKPDLKNIKAGSWIKWSGYFEGDMQSYEIQFELEDGTQKKIIIANDESDNSISTKGVAIRLAD